jgi:hypothetical protein
LFPIANLGLRIPRSAGMTSPAKGLFAIALLEFGDVVARSSQAFQTLQTSIGLAASAR